MSLTDNYEARKDADDGQPEVPASIRDTADELITLAETLMPQVEQLARESRAVHQRFELLGWGEDADGDAAFERAHDESLLGELQALHSVLAHLLLWTDPMGGTPTASYIEKHSIYSPLFWDLYYEWDRKERRARDELARRRSQQDAA